MKNSFYHFGTAVIILIGVISLVLAFCFPNAGRIFISAVISVMLVIYLIYYLTAGHELQSKGQEESVTYLEWGKKISFSQSYVHDTPVEHELCFYRESGFIKARCNHEDRFLCPFDIISYTDNQKQVHSCLILPWTKGYMFNQWNYIIAGAVLLAVGVLGVSCSVTANQKYKSAFDEFFVNHTSYLTIAQEKSSVSYQKEESFQDFRFLLTICQGADGTAQFMKLFCINGKNYQLHVITLNLNLMINGSCFRDDINTALLAEDYSRIAPAVSSYFRLRADNLLILDYEAMCSIFHAQTIALAPDSELYQYRYVAEHRPKLDEINGFYSYDTALQTIAGLQNYTEQCIINHENGTMYLEQIVSDLENDLLYGVLCDIAEEQYHTADGSACLLTDMSETEYHQIYDIINYRPSTFLNQFQSAENRTVLPYLSECEIVFTDRNLISAYVPEGYTDSRIIRELYYTILGK